MKTLEEIKAMSLEQLEAYGDELIEKQNSLPRSSEEWRKLGYEIKSVEDAIFAITG